MSATHKTSDLTTDNMLFIDTLQFSRAELEIATLENLGAAWRRHSYSLTSVMMQYASANCDVQFIASFVNLKLNEIVESYDSGMTGKIFTKRIQ